MSDELRDYRNKMQIFGGNYTDYKSYYGFIDCSDYTLIIEIEDSKLYTKIDYSSFLEFLENSDYKNVLICKKILTNIVLQCYWDTSIDFVMNIRAKIKLLGLTSVDVVKAVEFEVARVTRDLGLSNDDLINFTFECLEKVCLSAKENKILPAGLEQESSSAPF